MATLIRDFKSRTIVENANGLVGYLPDGRIFAAKNIAGTNLRLLYEALAKEYTRFQNQIYTLATEYDLATTTSLIEEWESALMIPDTCLSTDIDLTLRRKQIVAKFALMNITTEADWIALAKFFGFDITITYGAQASVFPMKFTIYFSGSIKAARFTMIVNFLGMSSPSDIFPLTFPVIFGDTGTFLMCLFQHLKPANVLLKFEWGGEDTRDYLIDNDPAYLTDEQGVQLVADT